MLVVANSRSLMHFVMKIINSEEFVCFWKQSVTIRLTSACLVGLRPMGLLSDALTASADLSNICAVHFSTFKGSGVKTLRNQVK